LTRARRSRAIAPGYHAQVGGVGGSSERIEIDEEGDLHAICAAFGASSRFGHALGDGQRFLGYFEAGNARTARETRETARGIRQRAVMPTARR
jgi:hypothetical protein